MMKVLIICFCVFLVSSCLQKKVKTNLTTITEQVKIDVFSLTYHQQQGSCSNLPITHKVIVFPYIQLKSELNDVFYASMEILLDSNTKTYKALYHEYSGVGNSSDYSHEITLEDDFEIIKADADQDNDELILQNLGRVVPILNKDKINFQLELNGNLNKEIVDLRHPGRVERKATSLIDDNCAAITSVE